MRIFIGLVVLLCSIRCSFAASTPAVVAGGYSALILSSTNTVCSVGKNEYRQLGNGTRIGSANPVTVSYLSGSIAVSIGLRHGLAVKADGTVWSWGDNTYGQLGDGTDIGKSTPYPVPGLSNFVSVSAGASYSLALRKDGSVWAWGFNVVGELGDGTTTSRPSPVQVANLSNVMAIASLGETSYALKNDGTVWAWGWGDYGQIGNGSTSQRTIPTQVPGLTGVVRLAAGVYHALALRSDGTVWAWGYNNYGQLGDSSFSNRSSPVRVGNLTGIVAVAGGSSHSLAVDSGGSVWTWGNGSQGQLGDGGSLAHLPYVPFRVQNFSDAAAAVAASYYSSYVLKTDGSLWSWGDNTEGQLGTGTPNAGVRNPVAAQACAAYPSTPGPLPSSLVGRLSAHTNSSVALSKSSAALSWGLNDSGQLGDGTRVAHSAPAPVQGINNASIVSLGRSHGIALRNDGRVSVWGVNASGQLGDGTLTGHDAPIVVPNLTGVTAVAAGYVHSLALKNDGTVWAWGDNSSGVLGDGTTMQRTTPVRVPNLVGVIQIATKYKSSYALKADGTVWCWGYNYFGQLGDNTRTDRAVAAQVPNLSGVTAIAAGTMHVSFLKNDGTVWSVGSNGTGQLGDGTIDDSPNLVRAYDLTDVIAIAAGGYHSLAIKNDGTAWAWGSNNQGQLGDGTTSNRTIPVQVAGLGSAVALAGGSNHSLALLKDGSLWAWGDNVNGQFGASTPAASKVPVQTASGFGPFYKVNLTKTTPAGLLLNANPPSSDGVYVEGTRVCFTPAPAVGWAFAGYGASTIDASGCLTASANASVTANFTSTPALRFVPVTPCRVADTRDPAGAFGAPVMAADSTRDFTIPQSGCSIPATAKAYSLNFTVVPPAALTYLSAWPAGSPRPLVSVLNSFDGRVKANAAIVPAGKDGAISVYVSDATHTIIDIDGYFVDAAADANALAFYPVTPCRLTDTRQGAGLLGPPALVAKQTRNFPLLAGGCNLPASAKAYSLNMTVVPKGPLTYLTVWPAGTAQPLVSTLNAFRGEVAANAAIVPAGQNGDLSVFATDNTELIVDVNGYFAAPASGGLSLYNATPCRVVDTRSTAGTAAFNGSISVNAATSTCYVPGGAQTIVFNATVVPPGPLIYLSLWPSGQSQPLVSTLNSFDGVVASNLAVVPANAGSIDAFTSNLSHLILDVSGYFAP